MSIVVLIVMSATVYRITRFIELDTMLEDTRDRIVFWLEDQQREGTGNRALLARKVHDGLTCAFCVSIWVAGFATLWLAVTTEYELGWFSIVEWLAVATGAMVFYRYIDPPE